MYGVVDSTMFPSSKNATPLESEPILAFLLEYDSVEARPNPLTG